MTGKEIFSIPTANLFTLKSKIEKLAKRAEKLGVYNNPDIDPELSKKLKEIFKRI